MNDTSDLKEFYVETQNSYVYLLAHRCEMAGNQLFFLDRENNCISCFKDWCFFLDLEYHLTGEHEN